MSSGESGDESSGIESPGPIGTVPGTGGPIQVAQNSIDMVRHQQQEQQHHHHQQQIHTPNSTQQQQQQDDSASKGLNSNNMGSLLYPAAALANLPQEVLLSLVQGGHLQIHQEDGKHSTLYFMSTTSKSRVFHKSYSITFATV